MKKVNFCQEAFAYMYVSFTWRKLCYQVLRATSSSSLCYLKDLFSAAVSSTTLYQATICTSSITCLPGNESTHTILPWWAQKKTPCSSTNYWCLDSELKAWKCRCDSSVITMHPVLHIHQGNEHTCISRTWYSLSIHGPGKEARWSLALEQAQWPILFIA